MTAAMPARGARTGVDLVVNGESVSAEVEPRTHLADFLREEMHLTGTHLGCEHGVCGACTLLIDGAPARSCITFAAACSGRDVRSIEGLQQDEATAALRDAFSVEHALQCGFCTPGMMITARDIVLNLPDADDDRVRLELAGNLCRCTGYNGVVRAIRRVLDQRMALARPMRPPLPAVAFAPVEAYAAPIAPPSPGPAPAAAAADGVRGSQLLRQSLRIASPRAAVWAALCDPALVAGCVPGASLTELAEDGRLSGAVEVALGPVRGRFAGTGAVRYDHATFTGVLSGEGRDRSSSRLSAEARFAALEETPGSTVLELTVAYALRGPLAQFGRAAVVQVFANEMATEIGRNLEARLAGETPTGGQARLMAGGFALRALWRWLRALVGRA